MRAALLEENNKPLSIVEDIDIEAPKHGEVVVKVTNCGICHSDLTMVDTPGGGQLPVVLGHEAAGIVEEIGPGVSRLAKGDKVMLTPLGPCGVCYYCSREQPTLCVDGQTFMVGTRPDGTSPLSRGGSTVFRGFNTGGFGEHTVVSEANAVKIDDDIPLEVACVIGCAIQTGVGAVLNTAKVEEGATVFVGGLGGIGISIVQGARLAGASRIIVSDPVGERRDHAANFGATHVVDPTTEDAAEKCREYTRGIGVDYAFDGAGSTAVLTSCVNGMRNGGTTVMVGAPMAASFDIPIPGCSCRRRRRSPAACSGPATRTETCRASSTCGRRARSTSRA